MSGRIKYRAAIWSFLKLTPIVFYSAWHGPFNVYYVCKRDGDKKSPCHTVKKRYLLDLHNDSTMFLRSMISRFFSPNFSIWSLYVNSWITAVHWWDRCFELLLFFKQCLSVWRNFLIVVLCFWRKTDTVTVNFKRLSYLAPSSGICIVWRADS